MARDYGICKGWRYLRANCAVQFSVTHDAISLQLCRVSVRPQ